MSTIPSNTSLLTSCGICLEDIDSANLSKKETISFDGTDALSESMTGIATKCNHFFHEYCLGKWIEEFKNKTTCATCPSCRGTLIDKPALEENSSTPQNSARLVLILPQNFHQVIENQFNEFMEHERQQRLALRASILQNTPTFSLVSITLSEELARIVHIPLQATLSEELARIALIPIGAPPTGLDREPATIDAQRQNIEIEEEESNIPPNPRSFWSIFNCFR